MIIKRSKGYKHIETGMNRGCNYIGEFFPMGVPHSCRVEFSVGAFNVGREDDITQGKD